jgi:hypothetical protein
MERIIVWPKKYKRTRAVAGRGADSVVPSAEKVNEMKLRMDIPSE